MQLLLMTANRALFVAALGVAVLLLALTAADAQGTSVDREMKLNSKIERLDRNAGLPHGSEAVHGRLAKTFNLPSGRIAALVDRSPGYGELMVVLAIAEKMAGGLTDENINKVIRLRQGHKGWGEITRTVDVKLTAVLNRVETIERNAENDVKKAAMEKGQGGRGAGGRSGAGKRSGPRT